MYVISFRWRGLYRGGLLRRMLNQTSDKGAAAAEGRHEIRPDKAPPASPEPPRDEPDGPRDLRPSQN
jgi:hypothetical protein